MFVIDSKTCGVRCSERRQKLCGSDKVTYNSRCELEEAKCRNKNLRLLHYGECRKFQLNCYDASLIENFFWMQPRQVFMLMKLNFC